MAAVQLQNPLGGVVQKVTVVGDGDHGARKALQELLKPVHRFGVQVVGGLVKQQHVGFREQQAAQRHAALFTAGEHADLGVPGRQAQRVGGDLKLVLRVRAAAGDDGLKLSLLSGQRVKVGIRLAVGGVHGLKACLGGEHITHAGFHAFAHSVRVIELGFLRQVADVQVGHGHGLALDLGVQAGHDLEQSGLARAIGAQHADLGAREKAERHILQNLALGWNGLADLVHGENVLGHQGLLLKKTNTQKGKQACRRGRRHLPEKQDYRSVPQ